MTHAQATLDTWPKESKEAALLVIDTYGEPEEICESTMTWNKPGTWKRIIAYRQSDKHNFPAPHIDCIESFINYEVPGDKVHDLNTFDGSIVVNRTRGEISARCHDVQANSLALNLAHDIIIGEKTANEARAYYAKEFLGFRKNEPTPYMDKLQFDPGKSGGDSDTRLLSDKQLAEAVEEGKSNSK